MKPNKFVSVLFSFLLALVLGGGSVVVWLYKTNRGWLTGNNAAEGVAAPEGIAPPANQPQQAANQPQQANEEQGIEDDRAEYDQQENQALINNNVNLEMVEIHI